MDFSAGAVVYKIQNDKPFYLLAMVADGEYWGFPKGHPEIGESLEQTISREVLEETGHVIHISVDFKYDMRYTMPSGEEKLVTLLLAQSIKENPIVLPNKEIAEIGWFSYDDAIKKMKFGDTKEALQKAHEFISHQQGNVT